MGLVLADHYLVVLLLLQALPVLIWSLVVRLRNTPSWHAAWEWSSWQLLSAN